MQKSAIQLHIEAQLQAAIDLLKQAKRYVGQSTTIGGQDLSKEITEFVASVDRNPVLDVARDALQLENQRITPVRAVCLACGGHHPTSNLPCPHMVSYANTDKS